MFMSVFFFFVKIVLLIRLLDSSRELVRIFFVLGSIFIRYCRVGRLIILGFFFFRFFISFFGLIFIRFRNRLMFCRVVEFNSII